MAITVSVSPGTLILLFCLQSVLPQQLSNNNVSYNPAGGPQQSQPKPPNSPNHNAQNSGLNFNPSQQANFPQPMNLQQQSNIQQVPFIQQPGNMQPQSNQFSGSQNYVNSNTNSQLQQQNQNVPSSIFSALHNIRQSTPIQGTNVAKATPTQQGNCCGIKQNTEQNLYQSQNQPSSIVTFSNTGMNKPQIGNQPSTTTFVESQQFQPMFSFQSIPSNNAPFQQNQQNMLSPATLNSYANSQNQGNVPNQPISNFPTSQQATTLQNPMVMIPSTQTNGNQNQPIVLTFQAPQPTSQSQPVMYTVQSPQFSASTHNQKMISNQPQAADNIATDNQSLMSYVMSQMQNSQGNNNPLASILPALLNTKSEKSSSMKTLLPLILSMLNEKRNSCGGCACPHCGCKNYSNQNTHEPIINGGYSNQKNYSPQEPIEEVLSNLTDKVNTSVKSKSNEAERVKYTNNEITDNSSEASDEEEDDSEEDEDDDE